LQHPADLRPLDPPASEGASLSCAGADRFTLLEGFGLENEGPGGRNMVGTLADGIVATLGQEEGHANGQLIRREPIVFRNADHCERLVVSYTDQGVETTTDYFIVGKGRKAVMLAFKVLSLAYEAKRPLFDRVIETLRAPWLMSPGSGRPARRPNKNDPAPPARSVPAFAPTKSDRSPPVTSRNPRALRRSPARP
jgi:hypothetical protein